MGWLSWIDPNSLAKGVPDAREREEAKGDWPVLLAAYGDLLRALQKAIADFEMDQARYSTRRAKRHVLRALVRQLIVISRSIGEASSIQKQLARVAEILGYAPEIPAPPDFPKILIGPRLPVKDVGGLRNDINQEVADESWRNYDGPLRYVVRQTVLLHIAALRGLPALFYEEMGEGRDASDKKKLKDANKARYALSKERDKDFDTRLSGYRKGGLSAEEALKSVRKDLVSEEFSKIDASLRGEERRKEQERARERVRKRITKAKEGNPHFK